MEIKRVASLIVFIFLLTAGFLFYYIIYLKQPQIQGYYLLNNGRNRFGCLVNSGYKWDNSSQNCIKQSLNNTITYQITDFKSCLAAGYAISENGKTRQLQCRSLNGTLFLDNSIGSNIIVNKTNITKISSNITLGNTNITNNSNNS